jgi:hypothetical protein
VVVVAMRRPRQEARRVGRKMPGHGIGHAARNGIAGEAVPQAEAGPPAHAALAEEVARLATILDRPLHLTVQVT